MWYRIAGVAKLVPGNIKEPVAVRRVHNDNRFTKVPPEELKKIKLNFYTSLLDWAKNKNLLKKKWVLFIMLIFLIKTIGIIVSNQNTKE
jgi:hypothetical protein